MLSERTIRHLVEKIHHAHSILKHSARRTQAVRAIRRIIYRQRRRLFDVDDCVNAETRQPAVKPPVDHLVDFFAQGRVFPVEIRLFLME